MLRNVQQLNEADVVSVTGGTDTTIGIGKCIIYKVKKNESLADIALRYGTSLKKLCELNGIKDSKALAENDSLLIPTE